MCRKSSSEFLPWYVVVDRERRFAWRSFCKYCLRQLDENKNDEVK